MSPVKHLPLRPVAVLLVLVCAAGLCGLWLFGCGDDTAGVDPASKLCRGESGFGARIERGAGTIDMCVPDQAVVANYIPVGGGEAKYEIEVNFTTGGVTIEVLVHFYVQPTVPATLTLTANPAEAASDRDSAWFYYRETGPGGYDNVGVLVSGVLTVTFNDPSIAVATFSGAEITLEDNSTGDPAGGRTISEGYVSVTAD